MEHNQKSNLYDDRIKKYGSTPISVGWKDINTQYLRFETLINELKINKNSSILDLGCGYGALINFLHENKIQFSEKGYLGIDVSKNMIEIAKKNHENFNFKNIDFFKIKGKKFDFIICSGALNLKESNKDIYCELEKFLKVFFKQSKFALTFNLIHDMVDYKDKSLNYYELPIVVKLISNFTRFFTVKNNINLYETSITMFNQIK